MARDATRRLREEAVVRSDPRAARKKAKRRGGAARFVVQEHHATASTGTCGSSATGCWSPGHCRAACPTTRREPARRPHGGPSARVHRLRRARSRRANTGQARSTIWDSGSYEAQKFHSEEVIVHLPRRAVEREVRPLPDRRQGLADPPDGPARRPGPRAVAGAHRADARPAREAAADDARWAFELKWDGIRAIAYAETGRLRLESRSLRDDHRALPRAARARRGARLARGRARRRGRRVRRGRAAELPATAAPHARRARAEALRRREGDPRHLRDLRSPSPRRRARCSTAATRSGASGSTRWGSRAVAWRTPEYHRGDGAALLAATREPGSRGDRRQAPRRPVRAGPAQREWLKVKNVRSQEFVIGGWVPGKGRREGGLGALLAGYYDGEGGSAGCATRARSAPGSPRRTCDCCARRSSRWRRTRARSRAAEPPRDANFVRPELVAEIEFSEWTNAGTLRHPSYKGLRDDKPPEVIREEPDPAASGAEAEEAASHRS